jgi:hypothetical protein
MSWRTWQVSRRLLRGTHIYTSVQKIYALTNLEIRARGIVQRFQIWEGPEELLWSVSIFVTKSHPRRPLTGESRIEPTRLMLMRRMKRFPICFMISERGSWTQSVESSSREAESTHANLARLA